MSQILESKLAEAKNRNSRKFPAVFEKALDRFNYVKPSEFLIRFVESALGKKKPEPSMSQYETAVWAEWGNLTKASKE